MRVKKKQAQAGETAVKHSVILPAYEMLLWLLVSLFSLAAIGNIMVLWSYRDPLNKTKRNEFMLLQVQSVVFLAFYSLVPVLLIQRTVTAKAFRNTFLIVMPWLAFNIVMANLLISSYQCEVAQQTSDSGGESSEDHGNQSEAADDEEQELSCNEMPLEFPKGGELVFALSGPVPAFIFHFLCISGTIKSRIELRSRSAKFSTFFACIYSLIILGVNLFGFLYSQADKIFIHLMQVGSISLLLMNVIFPVAIYKSLIADTKYWRGLGKYSRGIGQTSGISDVNGEVGPVSISVASTNMQNMMSSHIIVDFSHLKVGKRIGKGSTATVYMGEFKREEVAIKVFIPPEITEDEVNSFSQEASMAAGLIHKNIVKTIGICVRPPSIALVTEYCEHGNLGDFIRHPDILKHANMLWRFRCAIDAVAAVQYLHSCNILHRDIKADNYFLDSKGTVKLGDFGESTIYVRNKRSSIVSGGGKKMTIVGTVSNMAPEMINAQRRYTEAVDIYSLGVTLWEIWTAETPFEKFNQFQVYKMVGEKRVRPNFPDDMNPVYKQCVNASWSQTPRERPKARTLLKALCLEHDRINTMIQKVIRKMQSNVRERNSKNSGKISSGKSSEERRAGDEFIVKDFEEQEDLPVSLPLAFKMKSEGDISTLSSSGLTPPSEIVSKSTRHLHMPNVGKSLKSFKIRVRKESDSDSVASDLTEDEDVQSLMKISEQESLTVSLREYEKELKKKGGATSVTNPIPRDESRRRSRNSLKIISRLASSMESAVGKVQAMKSKNQMDMGRKIQFTLSGTLEVAENRKSDTIAEEASAQKRKQKNEKWNWKDEEVPWEEGSLPDKKRPISMPEGALKSLESGSVDK
eukprot:CAMPEP_0118640226 /NCGR_PEP_ID=MMETSP0785-20121206/4639_1 /TAXON_ID=91992 /ORGANISM="Bolidomonas pacifica, Strain CCMP 1866" /LENGTH=859 /DNA_ID=CAMNT_0006531597 /DNA_START=243 /DNA_END=2822 /DNA_ORIENTATION=+